MKTLAVIKNELFKDYLRFVSTNDLPGVLDNPDIPVPFTCLDSVDNTNADALMEQLKGYFNRSKVGTKDFYILDEETTPQLQFMLNLIKLSSGQSGSAVQATAPVVNTKPTVATPEVSTPPVAEVKHEPIHVEPPIAVTTPEVAKPTVKPTVVETPHVEVDTSVEDVFPEEDDPFGFKKPEVVEEVKSNPVPTVVTPVEASPVVEQAVEAPVAQTPAVTTLHMVASLGIPTDSVIQFIKDSNITAQLLDDKTVLFDGQNMTLVEAAKAAFKKSGTVGMAVGLSNWTYLGETLKAWKEKQLN